MAILLENRAHTSFRTRRFCCRPNYQRIVARVSSVRSQTIRLMNDLVVIYATRKRRGWKRTSTEWLRYWLGRTLIVRRTLHLIRSVAAEFVLQGLKSGFEPNTKFSQAGRGLKQLDNEAKKLARDPQFRKQVIDALDKSLKNPQFVIENKVRF